MYKYIIINEQNELIDAFSSFIEAEIGVEDCGYCGNILYIVNNSQRLIKYTWNKQFRCYVE